MAAKSEIATSEGKTHHYPSKRRSTGPIGPRPPELDDFVSVVPSLSFKQKLTYKVKQNPFVPIGAAATVVALTMGLYNLQAGNSRKQQIFMRARIGAQAFTVGALVLGVVYHNSKPSK